MQNTQIFSQDLRPSEAILWTGTPRQGVFLQASDALMVPFSIMWTGFAIFWEFGVYQSYLKNEKLFFMVLWGIPFILMGFYFLFFRFFVDSFLRSKTFYAITSQRVLIKEDTFINNKLTSIERANLPALGITKSKQNLVTIEFGPRIYTGRRRRSVAPPTFVQIKNGDAAIQMLGNR